MSDPNSYFLSVIIPVISAIIALIGAILTAIIGKKAARELEVKKTELAGSLEEKKTE